MSTSVTDYTLPTVQWTVNYMFANYWGSAVIVMSAIIILPCYISTIVCMMSGDFLGCVVVVFFVVFYFVMITWSFIKTHSTPAPRIPNRFSFTEEELAFIRGYERTTAMEARRNLQARLVDMARKRGVRTRCRDGTVSFCSSCRILKPERTHHCSICRKCVVRMDHHCPFFGNCIHFTNHKFFLQTLFYASLGTMYVLVTGLACISRGGKMPHDCVGSHYFWFAAMTSYCGLLAILVSLFFGFSMKHAACNQTTLEAMSDLVFDDGLPHTYDLGSVRRNLQQILGPTYVLWLVPVNAQLGDATSFPLKEDLESFELT